MSATIAVVGGSSAAAGAAVTWSVPPLTALPVTAGPPAAPAHLYNATPPAPAAYRALPPVATTPLGTIAVDTAAGRSPFRGRAGATLFAARFLVATEDTGGLSFGDKISGQMAWRGWTQESIQDTVDNPSATHDVWDFTSGSGEPATAYENGDGAYVVVNDQSGQVVQISDTNDPGWKPVWNDPRFQR